MTYNRVTLLTIFFLLLVSLSLSGMQKENDGIKRKRWLYTFYTKDFELVTQALDCITLHAQGDYLSSSIDNVDNGLQLTLKLIGSRDRLIEKFKGQTWFDANQLRECTDE